MLPIVALTGLLLVTLAAPSPAALMVENARSHTLNAALPWACAWAPANGPAMALAAPAPPVRSDLLIDEEVTVSPSKVRPLEFDLASPNTRVLCKFHVVEGLSGVRAVLLKRDDVRAWLAGRAGCSLASTGLAGSGGFMFLVGEAGAYAIVLDNRLEDRAAAVVHLQVKLLSGAGAAGPVQLADPLRARLLVWGSILIFGLASLYTGWRLKLALARRSASRQTPEWPQPLF
jgi:hypothetical protein